nr:uncharacterized protein LOC101948288 [Chrysemys picta bellii]
MESVSVLMKNMELISARMEALDLGLDPKEFFNGSIKLFEEFMDIFKDKEQAEVASISQAELESFKSTMLNIAVTGETGARKSSFINALRGLTAEDDGAAPTGVTEMTMKPTVYPYPNHPNVRLWDLPGIGAPDFQPTTYLKQVNFKCYDFFVIIASERFKCNHTALAREIERMGKRFYFVRSKVDEDLRNEERDHPRTFSQESVLQRLRMDCRKHLQNARMCNPEIFLLSSCEFTKYDAPGLVKTLQDDIQGLQRLAFLLSLPNLSAEIIEEKKAALKKRIWLISLASALVNVVPIPRLSVACDISILLGSMIAFYKYFGLDDISLANLARQTGKPIAELKAVIISPEAKEINRDVVIKLLLKTGLPGLTANLPVLGPMLTAGISFLTTYFMLLRFLSEVAEDAERVRKTALTEDGKKRAIDMESTSVLRKDMDLISARMEALDLGLDPKEFFNGSIKLFEEFMGLFKDKEQAEVASISQAELESFKSTILNIAVAGETGAGKSSFINALRGLTAEDDGAAPTGVTETTTKPTVYPYPNHPNVRLWDLPGIGAPDFQPTTYLQQVNFKRYDFFVIIASERFKCNHMALAQEIERMGKRFYFVRSKVDEDLRNEERDHPRTFREESVLQRLKMDCRKHLQKAGISNPEIFLLSSCEFTKYDAPGLVKTLQDDLPGLKRLAFLLSLPNLSAEIIEEKKAALKKRIWLISLASASVNVIPIPGLSVACDIGILLGFMIAFYKYFGLDDGSLANLARQTGKPIAELKTVIISPRATEINKDVVIKLLLKMSLPKLTAYLPVPKLTAYLPVLGPMLTVGTSFLTTYFMLLSFLSEVAEDAERVRKTALKEDGKKHK